MIPENTLSGAEAILLQDGPQRSRGAQVLACLAALSHWLGLALAALVLLVAGAFAALAPEPLWPRLLSLLILGFLPALAAYSIARSVSWILLGASAICDPVAATLWRILCVLIGLLRTCGRAVERVSRTTAFHVVTFVEGGSRVLMAVWRMCGRLQQKAARVVSLSARSFRSFTGLIRTSIHVALDAFRTAFVATAVAAANVKASLSHRRGLFEFALSCWCAPRRLFVAMCRLIGAGSRVFIMGAAFPLRLIARTLLRLFPTPN